MAAITEVEQVPPDPPRWFAFQFDGTEQSITDLNERINTATWFGPPQATYVSPTDYFVKQNLYASEDHYTLDQVLVFSEPPSGPGQHSIAFVQAYDDWSALNGSGQFTGP